jgi:tetratricopeptide (TPR) repeat protein
MQNKTIKYSFFFISIFILSSCGVWEDFTTYFNRWYNIKQIYNEIEADVKSQRKNIFSNDPLILSGTSRTNLPKLIDKCSDLLQFNNKSSFVDDVLMVLGKAFYYQANYQRSKRKFEELLLTNPSEKERLETELWIAKCEMQMRNFTFGLNALRSVGANAIVKDYDEIIEESFIEEIKYHKSIEDYTSAIDLLNRFIKYASDDEMLALIYMELGNLYSIKKDYLNARESYLAVIDYTSDFDIEIKATLNYATSLRLSNQPEKALDFLQSLKRKDKFIESFPIIEIEIGKTNVSLGNYLEGLDNFIKVDTSYKNSAYAALAIYEIGKLYQYQLGNFDSAAFYYNKSQLSNPPREYQQEIIKKNSLFNSYTRLRKTIDNYDRQLFYALNPEIFKQDSIDYVKDSLQLIEDYLEKKALADIWNNLNEEKQKNISINYLNLRDSLFVRDSIKLADSLNKVFVQLEPDSMINILISKALIRDSLKIVDSLNLEGIFIEESELFNFLAERKIKLLPPKEIKNQITDFTNSIPVDSINFKKNPPTLPKIPLEELKNLIAKNKLDLGNLFFTELDIPDSAYKLYFQISDNLDSTSSYPEALYGLGTYYLMVEENSKADSIFRKIYDEYKTIAIANSAADKLGLPLIDLSFDPGKELFLEAENYIKMDDHVNGIKNYLKIYKDFPNSKFADKGIYAAGYILENDLNLVDSAVTAYDTLISRYPNSEFVKLIAMKVTIYKQEKARIKKELEEAANKVVSNEEQQLSPAFLVPPEEDKSKNKSEELITENEPIFNLKENNSTSPKKKLERIWNPRNHRR